MNPRFLTVSILVIIEVLWLIGIALPETDLPEYEAYVAQSTQTISSIADEYGISPDSLARYNKISINTPLKTGQILLVPMNAQAEPSTPAVTETPPTAKHDQPALPLPSNKISGNLATVIAKSIDITAKPNSDVVVCPGIRRGKDLFVVDQTPTHYGVLMKYGTVGWVPRLALEVSDTTMVVDRPTPPAQSTTPGRQDIVDTAFEYLGIPYKLGGTLPDSVDCSLLVQTVFRRQGIRLPRTAAQQYTVGKSIDVDDLIAGDRLYFHERGGTRISHTAIYIGSGRFIHASSNRHAVAVDALSNQTYASIYAGARR